MCKNSEKSFEMTTRKKSKDEWLPLSDIEIYYGAIMNKTEWYWHQKNWGINEK